MDGQGKGALLQIAASSAKSAVSVILVLLYGYIWRSKKRMSTEGESNISKLGTGLLLPCLLFSEIGPLSTPSNLKLYWPIIAFSLLFQLISFLVAFVSVRIGMPQHLQVPESKLVRLRLTASFICSMPLFIFNNVTSLPLLLLSALSSTGALDSLVRDGDTLDQLVSRGKVFFLLNALCGNLTRFAFGPYLMQPEQTGQIVLPTEEPVGAGAHIPRSYKIVSLSQRMSRCAQWIRDALNPPLVGGLLGIAIGVIPFTHSVFFSQSSILNPFTKSIETVGGLYTALQMFVLGAALYTKKGSSTSTFSLVWLFLYRFFIAPTISISSIYGVRRLLPDVITKDPILDFVIALSNVGPPALTLAAIADMADIPVDTEGQIARALVASYIVTPLIALSCTAAISVVTSGQ
ncbi:hypothetical protein OIV83_003797 [Microbotryomycetes sp. JL201]|nr:hypothetical protein OIV83_003797 [Microbotryomycetes sp. JL201]